MSELKVVENKTITTRKGNIRNLYTQTVCDVLEERPNERLCNLCVNGWVQKDSELCVNCGFKVDFENCLRSFVEDKEKGGGT